MKGRKKRLGPSAGQMHFNLAPFMAKCVRLVPGKETTNLTDNMDHYGNLVVT